MGRPMCPSAQFPVPPVDPIPQSQETYWDIKGRPMVSLSTVLCPTCPRDVLGHQGTSHGVPQHSSLSHLSIPSLSPQGTYGTSSTIMAEAITTIQTQTNSINHWVLYPILIVILELELFFSDSQALRCYSAICHFVGITLFIANTPPEA